MLLVWLLYSSIERYLLIQYCQKKKKKKFDIENFFSMQPFLYLFSCSFLFPFLLMCGSDLASYWKAGILTDLPGHIRPNQKSCRRHKSIAFQGFCCTHSCVVLMWKCESHAILPSSVNCCWSLITVGAGVHPSIQQMGCRSTLDGSPTAGHTPLHMHTSAWLDEGLLMIEH